MKFIYNRTFLFSFRMEALYESNPWAGGNLEEFHYYCCPECDLRNKSKEIFLEHAIKHHPKSKEFLIDTNIKHCLEIKEEPPFDDKNYLNLEYNIEFYEKQEILESAYNNIAKIDDDDVNFDENDFKKEMDDDDDDYEMKYDPENSNFTEKKRTKNKFNSFEVHEDLNLECDVCNKFYTRAQSLMDHVRKYHESEDVKRDELN